MHDITRDLLLKQAEREEREAERLTGEAQKLLSAAVDLDNEAAACRKTAATLRSDAFQKFSADLRGITLSPVVFRVIGHPIYDPRRAR